MPLIVCRPIVICVRERRMTSQPPCLRLFGKRVRDRRTELGISQEKLAEISGLHRTYVGSLERGERNVALVNLLRLAQGLAIDPGDLVQGLTP